MAFTHRFIKVFNSDIKLIKRSAAYVSTDTKPATQSPDSHSNTLYVDQAGWDRLSRGQLAIIAHRGNYAVVPVPVVEKIRERNDNYFIVIADHTAGEMKDDDPYAAYQIPDDLMW